MTIVPSLDQFDDFYAFNAYENFNNSIALTVTATDPSINIFLLNNIPAVISWKLINLNDESFYYGVLSVSSDRHAVTISGGNIKFEVILYGSSGSGTYALPAGISLDVATDLPSEGMKSGLSQKYCTVYTVSINNFFIFQPLHQFKMQY